MTTRGKALVPLLALLAVLAIGVSGVAIFLQMQERDKRLAAEHELMITLSQKDDLEKQLQNLKKEKAEVEKELSLSKAEVVTTKGELEGALAAKATLTKAVEDREKEIGRLTKDLEQIQGERKQLAVDLGDLRAGRWELQKQIDDLTGAKRELESKVLELAEQPTVELEKIVVSEPPAPGSAFGREMVQPVSLTTSPLYEGRIIVVNREYDFVVMNLGKSAGLAVGQEFQIVQDTEVVGRVRVEKIYDELSAAAILPESDEDLIQEGDLVRAL